jgi:hypothetical protein
MDYDGDGALQSSNQRLTSRLHLCYTRAHRSRIPTQGGRAAMKAPTTMKISPIIGLGAPARHR